MKVYVNVTDENDNNPIFYPSEYYVEVPETAGVGYTVLAVTASDSDSGDNGAVSYRLLQEGSSSPRFAIDSASGVISVAASLPTSQRNYTLQVGDY